MDALVLCGGKGTRLASVVSALPKSLAPIHGRPFLDYVLEFLSRTPLVSRVVLATGYLSEQIQARYADQYAGLPIVHCREEHPLGTGGAILHALKSVELTPTFFILNGDSFVDVDLPALQQLHGGVATKFAMSLFHVDDAARFGTVITAGTRVTGFVEKTGLKAPGQINAGIYLTAAACLDDWRNDTGPVSLENDIIPTLVARKQVVGLNSGSRFIDIGLPETYAQATTFFAAQ